MTEKPTEAFLTVLSGMCQLDEMTKEEFESDEADDLRDTLDAPWYELSTKEIDRLRGLTFAEMKQIVDDNK